MKPPPQAGEVWFADFGFQGKPRWTMVVASRADGRLALASVVLVTTQFAGTPYEISLPRVPWLREQSYINAQSIQPVKLFELVRKAPGQFESGIFDQVRAALQKLLRL